jgi:hypothetical protein
MEEAIKALAVVETMARALALRAVAKVVAVREAGRSSGISHVRSGRSATGAW